VYTPILRKVLKEKAYQWAKAQLGAEELPQGNTMIKMEMTWWLLAVSVDIDDIADMTGLSRKEVRALKVVSEMK
jgi:hypothetical protein